MQIPKGTAGAAGIIGAAHPYSQKCARTKVAHDDPTPEEFVEHLRPVAHLDPDEVGLARAVRETQLAEGRLERLALSCRLVSAARDLGLIAQ